MDRNKDNINRLEQAMAETWREQSTPEPSEAWHASVMAAIAVEKPIGPRILPATIQIGLAWRAACVTAAAAIVVTAVGLWITPSDARLAWQLQRDGAGSEWALLMGD